MQLTFDGTIFQSGVIHINYGTSFGHFDLVVDGGRRSTRRITSFMPLVLPSSGFYISNCDSEIRNNSVAKSKEREAGKVH